MGKKMEYSIGDDSADRKTAFFFALPFGVAGRIIRILQPRQCTDRMFSLANEEEQIDSFWGKEDGGAIGQEWRSGPSGH